MGREVAAMLRHAAVAGTWYPGEPGALVKEVERYLSRARTPGQRSTHLVAVIAPHAGLMYSGPVAAHAYALLEQATFDVAVLVGPSHYVAFDGVAVWPDGSFETPLGPALIEATVARGLLEACPVAQVVPAAHAREHSLEMQLPFIRHLAPDLPIVPIVMGDQTRATIAALGQALVDVLAGRQALLVASTDLSHFFDRSTADRLDGRTAGFVARFDVEGLLSELERYPEYERGRFVMCGAGPAIAVMTTARGLGASQARVLARANSGDISGDDDRVVGYLAAAFEGAAPAH
jgi:AmmeMemoRadiSam system protein B